MRRTTWTRALAVLVAVMLAIPAAAQDDSVFEVETLNRGLPAPPEAIDRSTPRATLESFLKAGARADWDAAAHLLDLSDIDPAEQSRKGPILAQRLGEIIERKVVINWSDLIDRPDGIDMQAPADQPRAGEPRRSLLLWSLDLPVSPAAIRLNRVAVGGADGEPPVWVFASRTVDRIDDLYAAYGPSRFETYIPAALKRDAIGGLMWWELVGLPLLLALAAAAGVAVNRSVRSVHRAIGNPLLSDVIRATRVPFVIAAVTLVLYFGITTFFVFSGRIDAVLSPLVAVGFTTAALLLVLNTVEAALDRIVGFDDVDLTQRKEAESRELATKIAALRRVLMIVVFVVGAGIVLSSADVFESLGWSLLASAGALTLVLGFAARRVLGNIMSSLQIALNQSARIGDRVVFKGHLCHVERINFTYVQLRDWDGTRLVVPVEEFVSEAFENWTMKEPDMLRILKFKLDPAADVAALRHEFMNIVHSLDQDEVYDPEAASVKVAGQDVFGIDVWFAVPCADPNTSWDIACEAREKLVARMARMEAEEGARIFPEARAIEDAA